MTILRHAARLLPDALVGALRKSRDYARQWPTRHIFDPFGSPDRAVFVAGTGRSGTTWLANLLNYDNRYRYLFEPLHPTYIDAVRHFDLYQYLRPGDRRAEFLEPVRRILSGRIRDPRIDKLNRRSVATRRLVKDVFANLYLGWLREAFPSVPIVMILRHPMAVADSQRKLDHYIWLQHASSLLEQPDLVADFLGPFVDEISRVTDPFEAAIVIWALVYLVPLRQLGPGQVHVCFYEHLCERPEEEIAGIERYLGRRPGAAWRDKRFHAALSRPSEEARPDSPVLVGGKSVDAWMRQVTTREIDAALRLLDRFGMGGIYGSGAMPDPAAVPRRRNA
jgi:Sulfotransferase family